MAESRKQRRDAALTWDVPPELDAECVKSATHSDDPLVERPTDAAAVPAPPSAADGGRAPCNALVSVYRQAFAQTARDHLAAIVAQLLQAEGFSVRSCTPAVPRVTQCLTPASHLAQRPPPLWLMSVSAELRRATRRGSPASHRWRWKQRTQYRPPQWRRRASETPATASRSAKLKPSNCLQLTLAQCCRCLHVCGCG